MLIKRPLINNDADLYCIPKDKKNFLCIGSKQTGGSMSYYIEQYDMENDFVKLEKEKVFDN